MRNAPPPPNSCQGLFPQLNQLRLLPIWAALTGLFGSACAPPDDESGPGSTSSDASTGGGTRGTSTSLEDVGPITSDLECGDGLTIAESPLFKLSTDQYKNSVRDLLRTYDLDSLLDSVESELDRIPSDSMGDSFRRTDTRIAIEHVQGFFDVGVSVGDALAADESLLESVAGSCASEDELGEDCWDDFKSGFLKRALRHPLSAGESDLFDALLLGSSTGPDAIRSAVVVALSSPRFVYQVEVDGSEVDQQNDDVLALNPYELASRMSYTFWQTMPDDELFARADDGSLLEESVYREQLGRVWDDPRTRDTIERFMNEWLRLEKFTGFETSRPGFAALTEGESFGEDGHDYYGAMTQEVFDLTNWFVFDEPGTLTDLLTTNISLTQSDDLASLYGVSAWDGSDDPPTVDDRAGLLQRAALLVSNLEQTNPFHRGALVRRNILCGTLAQPDPNALPAGSLDPPPLDEAQTTRQRFAAKVDGKPLCENCHSSFGAIGYVMESFDAVGRFRTIERIFDEETGELLAELPIDTMAEIDISAANEDPINGAAELNERIAQSGRVEVCLAENYFEYFARRAKADASLDECVIEDLARSLGADGVGLAGAFLRLAELPTFFTKKVGAK